MGHAFPPVSPVNRQGSDLMFVRYAARLELFGGTRAKVLGSGRTSLKGSLILLEGEETETGRLEVAFVGDATELFVVFGVVVEIDGCCNP